jgi:hypothetical protein
MKRLGRHTLKNESPGPKMIDGLMIVLSGFALKNAFSPSSFVLQLLVSRIPESVSEKKGSLTKE